MKFYIFIFLNQVYYGDSYAKDLGIKVQKVGRLAPNFPVTNPEDQFKGIEGNF